MGTGQALGLSRRRLPLMPDLLQGKQHKLASMLLASVLQHFVLAAAGVVKTPFTVSNATV